jgi:hypothetical protein
MMLRPGGRRGSLLAGCGGGTNSEPSRPNVNAPVIQADIDGCSNEYAFAYGLGLRAGCESDESLEDSELKEGTDAAKAYEEALQRNPKEAPEGFRAGVERGLEEQAAENSDVC